MAKYVPSAPSSVDESYGNIVRDALKETGDADTQAPETDSDDEGASTTEADESANEGRGDQSRASESADGDGAANRDGKGRAGDPSQTGKQRGPKDLTLSDGTVIKGGTERRLYEKALAASQRADVAQSRVQELQRGLQEMQAKLQKAEAITTAGDQLQLTREDQDYALRMMHSYKRNPIETLKLLLADAQAAGYKLDGIGSGVDQAAIEKLVAQKLAPLTAKAEAESAREAGTRQSMEAINTLYTRFPDARVHDGPLSVLVGKRIEQGAPATLDTLIAAYFDLRERAIMEGFDWSQPLAQQAEARRTAGNGNGQQRSGTQQRRSTPPPGRSGSGTVSMDQQFAATDGWDKILNDVMRE